MLSDKVKQWFSENAMGPMFQLSELQRQTGVECTLVGTTVKFNAKGSKHPVAQDLHNKVLEIGTWHHISNVDDVVETTYEELLPSEQDVVDETYGVSLAEDEDGDN